MCIRDRYNRVNILSIALATWSGFTALTGLAINFFQIVIARMGVGIGEAGGSPPSHSIISDMYSKEERAGALGFYSMGIPIGIMVAYFATAALLGSSTDDVDWRKIFIFLGLTGIALAVIVRLLIREPKRGAMEFDEIVEIEQPPFLDSLRVLLKIPAWWAMCFGIAGRAILGRSNIPSERSNSINCLRCSSRTPSLLIGSIRLTINCILPALA